MEYTRNSNGDGHSGFSFEANDPFFETWLLETAGLRSANTDAFFHRCHEEIQLLLAYTLVLNGRAENPFQFVLDLPRHPRMNLI